MGDPKRLRRAYSKPRKSFQKERLVKEGEIKETYGLKNKKEFYRAESIIRSKRATARKLLALDLETRLKREKELLESLKKQGILQGEPILDDVLELTPEALLERRLQTIVWRKGLANTPKQSRQFITHGHIAVNGNKINIPSYIVSIDDEKNISYFGKEMEIEHTKHERTKKEESSKKLKEEFEEVKEEKTEINEEAKTEKKKEEVTING
jgi:small subunit ribosomal protein S4